MYYIGGVLVKYVFIVNPIAGQQNALLSIIPGVTHFLKDRKIAYSIEPTEYAGHATELVQKHASTGEDLYIFACGGDGTLHEVVNGAYGFANVAVGCIPCGSGNDTIRSFGTEKDFLSSKAIETVKELTIDLMKTPDGVGMNICSAGIDAAVAHRAEKYRRIPFLGGGTAYRLSIAESLTRRIGHEMTIQVDDETFSGEFLMTTIANGIAYGGGFKAAPFARMNDGLLDVILIKKIGMLRIAKVLPMYQKGEHFDADGNITPELQDIIIYRKAKHVHLQGPKPFVVNADGETYPNTDYEVALLPHAMRFLLPAALFTQYTKE